MIQEKEEDLKKSEEENNIKVKKFEKIEK